MTTTSRNISQRIIDQARKHSIERLAEVKRGIQHGTPHGLEYARKYLEFLRFNAVTMCDNQIEDINARLTEAEELLAAAEEVAS